MNDRAWEELIDKIDELYQIDRTGKRGEALEDNNKLKRLIESIEFERDNSKYKIERVTSPAIVDKKTYYSRVGGAHRLENIYDPKETTKKVLFFKAQPDGYWNEITPEELLS